MKEDRRWVVGDVMLRNSNKKTRGMGVEMG